MGQKIDIQTVLLWGGLALGAFFVYNIMTNCSGSGTLGPFGKNICTSLHGLIFRNQKEIETGLNNIQADPTQKAQVQDLIGSHYGYYY